MNRRQFSFSAILLATGAALIGGAVATAPASALPAMPEIANPGGPVVAVAAPDRRLYRRCRRKNRFIGAKRKSPRYLQAVEACVRGA